MSQQGMSFDDPQRDESDDAYTGYKGAYPSGPFAASYGQKLSPPVTRQTISTQQRLVLAIVSLLFWMGFFMIAVAIMGRYASTSMAYFIIALFTVGLGLFTALVGYINYIFNRKQ